MTYGAQYSIEQLKSRELDKHWIPSILIMNGKKYFVDNWTELIGEFINFLIVYKRINMSDLPIYNYAMRSKYFINSIDQHEDKSKDGQWQKIAGFYFDTKYNADGHKKNIVHTIDVLDINDIEIEIKF